MRVPAAHEPLLHAPGKRRPRVSSTRCHELASAYWTWRRQRMGGERVGVYREVLGSWRRCDGRGNHWEPNTDQRLLWPPFLPSPPSPCSKRLVQGNMFEAAEITMPKRP